MGNFDRFIACDLMRSVFVESDLVFPKRPRSRLELKFVGVNEFSSLRDKLVVTAGKVFNVFSRAKFVSGYKNSPALRKELLVFSKPSSNFPFCSSVGFFLKKSNNPILYHKKKLPTKVGSLFSLKIFYSEITF